MEIYARVRSEREGRPFAVGEDQAVMRSTYVAPSMAEARRRRVGEMWMARAFSRILVLTNVTNMCLMLVYRVCRSDWDGALSARIGSSNRPSHSSTERLEVLGGCFAIYLRRRHQVRQCPQTEPVLAERSDVGPPPLFVVLLAQGEAFLHAP